jgi:ribosomal protein S18 acetylase RimI-like enzyme
VLRLSGGYTRRANSVQPLYAGTRPLPEKIAAAEAFYHAHGQATVFKLTPASQPEGLDAALDARGFRLDAPTSVQALDLSKIAAPAAADTVAAFETLTDEWLAAFCALSQVAGRHVPTMRQMLAGLVPAHAFFAVGDGDATRACGLAVLEAGHVGLFDIVTQAAYRRQGHARRLIQTILAWAVARGAHNAYLQVMVNNAPALALYAGLGFEEVYRYWYRVKG